MAQAVHGVATPEIAIRLSLDRSGSRRKGQEAVVPGVNGFIGKMQKDPSARRTHFTLVTWDSQGFDTLRRGMMADIKPLEDGEFDPRALTPLHDAVASDIEALERVNAKRKVLVIDTDGLENYSKRFPNPEAIKSMIEAKLREGWVIIYLAANVDAWVQAKEFGIPESMAMNYRQVPATRPTLWQRVRGTAEAHPYATALLAIAGVALGVYLIRSLIGSAFSDEVDKLGFTDGQRNDAMGVPEGWQEAVAEDVATFEEPLPNIWALPAALRDEHMALPDDFDPALGSMVDGAQINDLGEDILSPEEVPTNLGGTVVEEGDVESTTDRGPLTGETVEGQGGTVDREIDVAPAPAPAVVEPSFFRDPDPEPIVRTVREAPAFVRDDPVVVERDTGGGGDVAEVETGGGDPDD